MDHHVQSGQQWDVPRSNAHLIRRGLRQELLAAIEPVLFGDPWEAKRIVRQFEQDFAAEMGYKYVSAVQSGSAGLRLSLLACGVVAGDEVITVANSDIATTAAISQCGGTPVLCDVLDSDFTMDPDGVESLVTERTVGILPVDLHGHPSDVRRLRQIADRHDLFIVEDAALATGARDYGEQVGSFADLAVFSCAPYKPFEGIGNGGLVVTDLENAWDRVELLKGYGMQPGVSQSLPERFDSVAEGCNLPMSPIDAAVMSTELPYLKSWTEKRRSIGARYEEQLTQAERIKVPWFRPESEPIFRTYAVRVPERDFVYRRLRDEGIQASLHYVPPVHMQPVYQGRILPGSGRLPRTEALVRETIDLPVDPEMGLEQVDRVCAVLRSIVDGLSER
jgi:dTDP-4-amino-4,6-dideoxygalactose transaminase